MVVSFCQRIILQNRNSPECNLFYMKEISQWKKFKRNVSLQAVYTHNTLTREHQ